VAYVKKFTDRRSNDTLTLSKIEPGTCGIQFHGITTANVTSNNINQLS